MEVDGELVTTIIIVHLLRELVEVSAHFRLGLKINPLEVLGDLLQHLFEGLAAAKAGFHYVVVEYCDSLNFHNSFSFWCGGGFITVLVSWVWCGLGNNLRLVLIENCDELPDRGGLFVS